MSTDSPDDRINDESDSAHRHVPVSETPNSIDEGLTTAGAAQLQPENAIRIIQVALTKLREARVPPYLADASSLIAYINHLEQTVAELQGQSEGQVPSPRPSSSTSEISRGGPGSEAGSSESRNNDDDASDSEPLNLTVERQIKVRVSSVDQRFFEDKGENSFSEEYSVGNKTKHPLLCRRVFNKTGVHQKTNLQIHSTALLETLKEVLAPSPSDDYERLFSQKVKFFQPYVVLFQNRRRLQAAAANEKNELRAALLRLLLDFMQKEMPTTWKKLDELEAGTCTHISFEDAWILYPPGTTVFVKYPKTWEAYKVQDVEAKHLPTLDTMYISSYYLDFDPSGTKLVPSKETLSMLPYSGDRQISDLEIIPASHLPDKSSICRDLCTGGEAFWEFSGNPAYRQYVGNAWPTTLATDHVRVIVDYVSPSRYRGYSNTYGDASDLDLELSDDDSHERCAICTWKYARLAPYPPTALDSSRICTRDRWSKMPAPEADGSGQQEGPEGALIFCPGRVWAFSLKHKSWKRVEVRKLGPVTCASDPFKKLVMSDQYKLVVESMVDSHLSKSLFSDIVKDKGRGLVVLLHGGPGTGKTLTAECVAEKKMRPLYMVTCGDLGTNPDELEKRLQRTFLYAVNWNAILLLDEADVFLQERDLQDLQRNALVSIFLRHIEYYDGLLFLTTNRPGQIDEAFQSRIHITLGLPELDFQRQKLVWLIFIRSLRFEDGDKAATKNKKLELLTFVDKELEQRLEKAGYHMNGRQIRNCIRAASAISKKHGRDLQKDDIINVIELGAQFKDYMQRVNRMTQDEKARALGLRLLQKD